VSRYDGFAVADVSTALFTDAKVRRLWRLVAPDSDAMCQAMVVYLPVVTSSWEAGERVDVDGSLPPWLSPGPEIVEALRKVKLLDGRRKIPLNAWEGWYGPAHARREERREAGRRGGLAKAARSSVEPPPKPRSSRATAQLQRSSSKALPVPYRTDTVPSSRAPAREESRGAGGPESLREALAGTPLGRAFGLEKEEVTT
jgi:hypothetical protein